MKKWIGLGLVLVLFGLYLWWPRPDAATDADEVPPTTVEASAPSGNSDSEFDVSGPQVGVPEDVQAMRRDFAAKLAGLPPVTDGDFPREWIELVKTDPEYRAAYVANFEEVRRGLREDWASCLVQSFPKEKVESLTQEVDGVKIAVTFTALTIEGAGGEGAVTNVELMGPIAEHEDTAQCIKESIKAKSFEAPPNGVPMVVIAPSVQVYTPSLRTASNSTVAPPKETDVWFEPDLRSPEERERVGAVVEEHVVSIARSEEFAEWSRRFGVNVSAEE